MKLIHVFFICLATIVLSACSTPKEKAYMAQEEVHNERLDLIDEYKDCIDDAGEDSTKVEACDSYLKAAEALQ